MKKFALDDDILEYQNIPVLHLNFTAFDQIYIFNFTNLDFLHN